jgi:hypothetical protein
LKYNPLLDAFDAYDALADEHANVVHELAGCAGFDDQALLVESYDLIQNAWDAARELSPRARRARLNLIWEDFRKKHQRARSCDGGHAVQVQGEAAREVVDQHPGVQAGDSSVPDVRVPRPEGSGGDGNNSRDEAKLPVHLS